MKMCNIRMSQVGDKDEGGAMLDLGPYKGVRLAHLKSSMANYCFCFGPWIMVGSYGGSVP